MKDRSWRQALAIQSHELNTTQTTSKIDHMILRLPKRNSQVLILHQISVPVMLNKGTTVATTAARSISKDRSKRNLLHSVHNFNDRKGSNLCLRTSKPTNPST